MQKHILVIEDNDMLRRLYSRALHLTGQAVHPAANLQEARELINTYPVDLILCDVELNGERGLDLLREQRDLLRAYGTHVIVASAEDGYRRECEELGVDLFLEKPVEVSPLLSLVGKLMSN